MADAVFKVQAITEEKGGRLAQTSIRATGDAVRNTGKSYKEAEKHTKGYNYTQNQGILGNASSGRSFSKLAQTMEGGGGIVGAYATLAANIFAVSAAFNALRNAAQVQQVIAGLEASGAKMGLSLKVAAKEVKELSGNLLSTEESLRSTAQVMAAGFKTDQLKALTQVAKDAAFALGRPMQDSMDRLTRGVVKLEPELLDELGIMTKLTESNASAALAMGKTVSQLTNFEKRQGFLNAVLAEGTLKFGGLSDAAGNTTNFDKLAATFSDVTKSILNLINNSGMNALAGFLASNPQALIAGMVLFASTIRSQLLPGLSTLAEKTRQDTIAARESLKVRYERTKADIAATQAANNLAVVTARKGLADGSTGPAVYRGIAPQMKEGTATTAQQNAAIKSLTASANLHDAQIKQNLSLTKVQIAEKQRLIAMYQAEVLVIREVQAAEKTALQGSAVASNANQKGQNALRVARRQASAQTMASSAVDLASTGVASLPQAFKEGSNAIGAYATSVQRASGTIATGAAAIKTAGFAIVTTTRVISAAFLTALPYIGLVFMAWSLLAPMFEKKLTPAQEEYNSKLEAFDSIISDVSKNVEAYNKIQNSTASASSKAFQQLTIQTNAIITVTDAYKELVKQKALAEAEPATIVGPQTQEDRNNTQREKFEEKLRKAKGLGNSSVSKMFGNVVKDGDDKEGQALVKTLESLRAYDSRGYDKEIKSLGGAKIATLDYTKAKIVAEKATQNLAKRNQDLSIILEEAKSAFGSAEKAAAEFMIASIPTTSFDGIANSSAELEIQIEKLAIQFDRGVVTGNQFADLLSGLGPSFQSLMSVDATSAISEYSKLEAAVTNAKNLLNTEGGNTEPNKQNLATVEAARNTAARQLNLTLREEVQIVSEVTGQLQQQTRVLDGQLKLEAAKIASVSNLYTLNGKGMLEGFKNDQRARGLMVQKLKLEMNIHENVISLNNSKIEQLRIEQKLILAQQMSLAIAEKNAKIVIALATPDKADDLSAVLDTSIYTKAKEEAEFLSREMDITVKQLQNSSRSESAIIENLKNSAAAALEENLTKAQELSRSKEKDFEISQEYVSILKDQASALSTIYSIQDKIKLIARGKRGDLKSEIELSAKALQLDKDKLAVDFKSSVQTLLRKKAVHNADIAAAKIKGVPNEGGILQVTNIGNKIEGLKRVFLLNVAVLDNAEQLKTIEAIIFDTRKEGLQWQIDSLSYYEKQVSAAKELSSITFNNAQLRAEIERKNSGLTNDENFAKSQEIEAAVFAYEQAQKGTALRVQTINLEFTLLEAQRVAVVEELRARKELLMTEAGLTEDSTQIRQLTASINNLAGAAGQVTDAKNASIGIVYQELEGLRLQVQKTIQSGQSRENKFMDQFSAFLGLKDMFKKMESAVTRTNKNPTLDKTPAQIAAEFNDNSMPPLLNKLKEIKEELKTAPPLILAVTEEISRDLKILVENSGKSAVSGTSGGKVTGYESLFGYMKNLGITPGNGRRASNHLDNSGDALDVNIGTGNIEAEIPAMKARIIAMAKDLASQGIVTLFNNLRYSKETPNGAPNAGARDHDDHAHVEIPRGWSPTQLTKTVEKAVKSSIDLSKQNVEEEMKPFAELAANIVAGEIKEKVTLAVGAAVVAGASEAASVPSAVSTSKPTGSADAGFGDIMSQMAQGAQQADAVVARLPTKIEQAVAGFRILSAEIMTGFDGLGPEGEMVKKAVGGMQTVALNASNAMTMFRDSEAKMATKVVESQTIMAAAIGNGMSKSQATAEDGMRQSQAKAEDFAGKFSAVASVASAALSTVQGVLSSASDAKIANIDREIAAEQRRDGKSADSLAKIASMEKKKDAIARKAFNVNKKIMMAQAVIATATGVAQALSYGPPGIPLAIAIGAMGAIQLAIIAGTSYQSSNTGNASAASMNGKLSIGKRGDSVDLAKQNTNLGGEVGYLRGAQGQGTNSSNYRVIGSAYGGNMPRGYGNSAYVVGEKGPETIQPMMPMSVSPANDNANQASIPNVNFNITAMDSKGVADVFETQKGNIISMLREAANANGQTFLENVDTNVYTRPQVSRL